MKLLAIVVNYRTAEMTVDAVRSLVHALEGIESRIVVVDNDSRDASSERIRTAIHQNDWEGQVVLVESGRNGGFAFGVNCGVRYGRALAEHVEYYYLLNSDAFPEPLAVRELVDHMDANRSVGIAGSSVVGQDSRAHHSAFRFPSAASEFERSLRLGIVTRLLNRWVVPLDMPDRPTQVDWVVGASMLIRASVFEQVGLFDEAYFLYYEETDFCRRAKREGWTAHYIPSSRIVHIGSVTTGKDSWARTPTYWFESRRYYFLKNHGLLYLWMANFAWLLGSTLWSMRRVIQRKPKVDPPGTYFDFIAFNLLGRRRSTE